MKKLIKTIFVILLIGILLISSYFIYKNKKEDNEQETIFEEIVNIAENQDKQEENNINDTENIDVAKLYEINNDIVGWIKINNTNINYPVMQRKSNPNYYLRRNFYKEYSQWGTPFLARDCNIKTSDNLVVYGHHINENRMFGELENYTNKEYYNNHSIIKLYTQEDYREYEIIYVFRTIAYTEFQYYNYINIDNENEFETFRKSCKKLELYNTEKDVNYGDKLITLSTCDYTSKNSRFVVVAKQINTENKKEEQIEEIKETEDNKIEDKKIENTPIKEKKVIKNETKTTKKINVKSTCNQDFFVDGHLKSYPSFSSKYATLKISKLNINAPIYFGATQEILEKGVAHDSGSYFCGENGSIIMCGHNFMNSFKRLGELKNGDLIEIKTQYGDFFYKIYNSKVIKDTELDELPIQKNEERLMIYTCYPFTSTGYTEYRYVLYANKI